LPKFLAYTKHDSWHSGDQVNIIQTRLIVPTRRSISGTFPHADGISYESVLERALLTRMTFRKRLCDVIAARSNLFFHGDGMRPT
jgi:hypothetical protein